MITEKKISQLEIGSYIVKITKQKGDYKIKQAGWVKDQQAIEFLKQQGVLKVAIDTSKRLNQQQSDNSNQLAESSETLAPRGKTLKARAKPVINRRQSSFGDQVAKAKKTFCEAKSIQSKVLEDIRQGRVVDPSPVVQITSKTIESIFENPDALACVLNIRIKDQYLLEHSVSVSILISIFAKFLELDTQIIHDLAVGAFLHDVGKILVPDDVLNKPGKLTAEEFEIIKTHVVHSKKIVYEAEGLSEVSRRIVANHHEKLNGQGYPSGLCETQLNQYDRMIAICDVFDALTAHRCYKNGIAQLKAFAILREMAQSGHLDPSLVDQFIRCLGIYPAGSLVKLTSNRLAIVDKVNRTNPTKPKVKVFYSLSQKSFTASKTIDLAKSDMEQIASGIKAEDFNLDLGKITEMLLSEG